MAEGGEWSGDDNNNEDNGGYDHGNDSDNEVINPFDPTSSSTPDKEQEKIAMKTRKNEGESSHDDTYDEKTPLLTKMPSVSFQTRFEAVEAFLKSVSERIKSSFPAAKMDFFKIGMGSGANEGQPVVFYTGKNGNEYEEAIFWKNQEKFLKRFTDKFSDKLGPRAETIISEDKKTIAELKKNCQKAMKELKSNQRLQDSIIEVREEISNLNTGLSDINEKLEKLPTTLEGENEKRDLEAQKRNALNRLKEADEELKKREKMVKDNKKKELTLRKF